MARNRAKRRMRAALATLRLRDGVDYVVIASDEVNRAEFDRLVRWIEEATVAGGEE